MFYERVEGIERALVGLREDEHRPLGAIQVFLAASGFRLRWTDVLKAGAAKFSRFECDFDIQGVRAAPVRDGWTDLPGFPSEAPR